MLPKSLVDLGINLVFDFFVGPGAIERYCVGFSLEPGAEADAWRASLPSDPTEPP